jgi:hypothetical protein
MPRFPPLAVVFVGLGVVFLALVLWDWLKEEGKLTPARKTWLCIAWLFAAVAIGLYLVHALSPAP